MSDEQLTLIPAPVLRSDLRWWHDRKCLCQRPDGAEACGSCPFTRCFLGQSRPSNRKLGIGPEAPA